MRATIWRGWACTSLLLLAPLYTRAADYPTPLEGDYTIRDFRFASGEMLPELRLHYRTLGQPQRDAAGKVSNAVLILHGTGGSGAQFLRPEFAGELFRTGGCSMQRVTSSSSPTASATAARASRATACAPASRIMATATWSRRSTGSSARG